MNDERIRIRFSREGGFAGRGLSTTIDSASLPPHQAATLRTLVSDAGAVGSPAPAARPGRPDGFRYRLSIEAGGQTREITVSDGAIPEALQPLLDYLTAAAKAPPPPA